MAKPVGRLGKNYRIIWDQNHGQESFYNPPIDPVKVAQAHFGFFEGTPVDAYMCALGPDCGYTVSYPTRVEGMEFIVDRYNSGALIGGVEMWRHAENIRSLWEQRIDPLEIQVCEARRLSVDFWFRLSMNDWHHADDDGKVVRIMGSRFYSEHQEYWIGDDGTDPTLPEFVRKPIARFQDFAIEDVRRLRIETAIEAAQRYDIAGFEYDFMRCPGYFKYDQVEANIPVMTQFIRDTRKALDEIGKQKGKQIGLSVRVPNTIRGSMNLGLDVPAWIDEFLVDIVVPSTFFNADLEEDISEWVERAASSPVRIIPAIEEGYSAGHTGGVTRCFYSPPAMLPLTHDMINAIAARHWRNGADGIYVFNWFGTAPTYDYDNRLALDDIGNPLRLKYKNKRYVVMRTDHSFPNCLPDPRQLPVELSSNPLPVRIDIADDLVTAGSRVECVTLRVHYTNLTVADKIKVSVNGSEIRCSSPIVPGSYVVYNSPWTSYDLTSCLLKCGVNEIVFQVVERNRALEKELAITVEDIEISIEYNYPNGKCRA